MALSYTADTVIVTDDAAPDREPLVLLLCMDRDQQDAAIAAYLAIPPAPNWDAFKAALLSSPDVNEALVSAVGIAPAAALALPAATIAMASAGPADFGACWVALREAGCISDALRNQVAAIATACHLPAEVMEVFNSRVRARNPDGTFRADDPTTLDVDEAWVQP